MTGGLFDPLGTDRAEPGLGGGSAGGRARPSAPAVAAGLMLVALAALVAVSWLRDDGDRGQPIAVGPIERVPVPPKPAAAPAAPAPPIAASAVVVSPAAPAGIPPTVGLPAIGLPPSADQEVEVQNGVRIVRPRRASPPAGGQTLVVPSPGAAR